MAIMIPSEISPEIKSTAERRIFSWFRDCSDTDDWIVLHSLGITSHKKVIYSEIDFFVLAPQLGLFALEVKGGRVSRTNGVWYFTNKYGISNSKIRGPFDQAKEGIFSIIEVLKKRLDPQHQDLKNVLFGFGVMFPDIEYEVSSIDEEQWLIFDVRNGHDVKKFIQRLAIGCRRKWESIYGLFDESKLPSIADTRYLASILRGDFDYAISLQSQLRNVDEAIIQLTMEQYRCLDQIDDNPRCLIQGGAGTGKTLLAIEEVKKSVTRGEKTALICFNSNLASWLQNYFSFMPSELQPTFIGTLHKYMTQLMIDNGVQLLYPSLEKEQNEYFRWQMPSKTVSLLNSESDKFDKLVIDEAQDLISSSYLEVMDASLKKGLARGRWTMFGDFSMQAIYLGNPTASDMKKLLDDYSSYINFKLTINCRNTEQICEEIMTVTGFSTISGLSLRIDGPPVEYFTYSSPSEQLERLGVLIDKLLRKSVEGAQITILSPRKRENSVLALMSEYTIGDFHVGPQNEITFSTIHSFKGLENTVIILTDIEDFSSGQLMYVAYSRARSALYILESESASSEYQKLELRRLLNER